MCGFTVKDLLTRCLNMSHLDVEIYFNQEIASGTRITEKRVAYKGKAVILESAGEKGVVVVRDLIPEFLRKSIVKAWDIQCIETGYILTIMV